ncbi:hypothetical protein C3489_36895 [Streptomyces sp. Ru71]|uniref:hypothetical protein n=1 Tax=Streptomyces sp. Ru71 TaxID=2080746 RepID=UPI000CDDD9E0|nr:hypothetical protein [Streptomyces sp. Ru71]POX44164.1 hypothetical protein C3489_36895 [Streptomyces sp. Ru71]
MDQLSALREAEAVREPARARGADGWESDLADLAALPLTEVDGLDPLPDAHRLLREVLRARGGMRGGGEGGGARAE